MSSSIYTTAYRNQSNEDVLHDNRPNFKYPGRKIEDWDLPGVYTLLDKSYLFQGMSTDLYGKLVNGMSIEYFSPNKDVILQDEAPTDFYIIANGAVVTAGSLYIHSSFSFSTMLILFYLYIDPQELLIMKNGVQKVRLFHIFSFIYISIHISIRRPTVCGRKHKCRLSGRHGRVRFVARLVYFAICLTCSR